MVLQNVVAENTADCLIVRLEPHSPRELIGLSPFRGAGGDKQMRHLLFIHVLVDGRIGRRAKGLESESHFVFFHQLADLFLGLRRAVAVIICNKFDLAAMDTAFGVDLLETSGNRRAYC